MKNTWRRSELTYCTNVHPGENLQQLSEIVEKSLSGVRNRRGLDQMAGGLWISHPVASVLSARESLRQFTRQIKVNAISLFTLNGFPAQGFHSTRVKEAVYHPDWSEEQRLEYTNQLANILATLLPDDVFEGTISTVPLGFRPGWCSDRHKRALTNLCHCLLELEKIHRQSGRRIRLCLEMEPGCVLQSTESLIPFFTLELPQHLARLNLDSRLIQEYLGICFDVCHQAVMFEDIYASLQKIHDAGIRIGKIQVSSALELKDPENSNARSTLASFIEQKYLHQSCCRDDSGKLHQVLDLDQAFDHFPLSGPWRVHFHVPIQAHSLISTDLTTTQQDIGRCLDFLRDNPELHPHLEVETYTWTALPEGIRPGNQQQMIDGLTAELNWLEQQMEIRQLLDTQSA